MNNCTGYFLSIYRKVIRLQKFTHKEVTEVNQIHCKDDIYTPSRGGDKRDEYSYHIANLIRKYDNVIEEKWQAIFASAV